MHRHKHLFEQICSFDNLLAASTAALRGKRSRNPGAAFYAEQEKELIALHEELSGGTYRHGGYNYFTIYEPKERQVAAAGFRDRVVHHALVRVLEPIFETRFIEDSLACRRGKGTHAAMRRASQFSGRFRYALKCDVRRYFPSIDHDILIGRIERVVGDPRVIDLLREVLRSHRDGTSQEWREGGDLFDVTLRPRGLPIGNLTSQFFANVYLNALDHFAKHDLRARGYVRYVDDFLLFADDRGRLKEWGGRVKEKLAALRLEIHPDKYRLLHTAHGVDFAGFVVFDSGRVRVRSDSVRRFKRRLLRMR